MRVSYESGQLRRADLHPTPLAQFLSWLQEVTDGGLPEPNAMVLATAGEATGVTARTVLLKGADPRGFSFFTNYSSRKAKALAERPQASLVFPWFAFHRQVTVIGTVEKLPAEESANYFRSRPRGSQLAAWASRQSEPIADRREMEQRLQELQRRWPDDTEVPIPDFWGGYLVIASSVEFWHGRVSRMHDRLRYEARDEVASLDDPALWRIQRYAP
ncbi:MAG: pyridoxamine 5'-phosphate oxidase [Actinobacteria bacterium]|nr:pyridoxamine 5'-phosphate oxidase [Actinomycetota bacterium]MCB9411819.1 pyridoxamine 5'-phosphate oxidase [Actinomycetota bacterium]